MGSALEALTARLAKLATHYDVTGEWPAQSLRHLTDAGAWTWVIPKEYGGFRLDPVSQTLAYEAVAAGCMSCLLILTQRDAACELIAAGENEELKRDYLPRFASNELMTSVGISQLTTSRQGGRPAMAAEPADDGFVLTGVMPWVTGAKQCDNVVSGAVLPDGRQILAVVPLDKDRVEIDTPMQLAALDATLTSEVHLRAVHIGREHVIRGPVEHVLASRSPVKPIVVATAGVGLAGSMVRLMKSYAEKAPAVLVESFEDLATRYEGVREKLMSHASSIADGASEIPKTEIRIAVNDLLMRLAVGLMTLAKGSGYVRQRDAQRLVREAMFFLVWSAPDDVRAGTLAAFADRMPPVTRTMARE